MIIVDTSDITEVGYSKLKIAILEAEMATTIEHIIPSLQDVPEVDIHVESDSDEPYSSFTDAESESYASYSD